MNDEVRGFTAYINQERRECTKCPTPYRVACSGKICQKDIDDRNLEKHKALTPEESTLTDCQKYLMTKEPPKNTLKFIKDSLSGELNYPVRVSTQCKLREFQLLLQSTDNQRSRIGGTEILKMCSYTAKFFRFLIVFDRGESDLRRLVENHYISRALEDGRYPNVIIISDTFQCADMATLC